MENVPLVMPMMNLKMNLPSDRAVAGLVCSITSPQALDQLSCCRNLSVEMFLSLFLLDLQCKT